MSKITVLTKPVRRQLVIRGERYVVTLEPRGAMTLRRWKGRKAIKTTVFEAIAAGGLEQLHLGLTRDVEAPRGGSAP